MTESQGAPRLTSAQRDELLEDAVADAVREGARIESTIGHTAVIVQPVRMRFWEHLVMLVLTVGLALLLWPLALLVVAIWVYFGFGRRVRWSLSIDDQGELEQQRLK